MKFVLYYLIVAIFILSCKSEDKDSTKDQSEQMMNQQVSPQPATSSISISDDVLIEIDASIENYSNELTSSLKKYKSNNSLTNKSELIESYVRFADYMQYESSVSPMKRKYRKALSLYRKALELDNGNSKVMAEITQIEDIYRNMGRQIPTD